MVGHRLRIFLVLLAVALNYVTCDFRSECPALAGPGCPFKNTTYPDGSYIQDQCLRLRCDFNKWVVTGGIDSNCGKCSVFLDPHITTSDGYTFELIQDACKYSLIQTGLTYSPDVGISGQFKYCKGSGSCPGETVFKDGNDSVEIGRDGLDAPNIFTVYVGEEAFTILNGNPTYLPGTSMLAWRSGKSCVQLLGESGLSMEKCEYHQFMWSHPNNAPYYGLCGFFEGNNSVSNDLTLRTGAEAPLDMFMVPSFGFSWLTNDQKNPECPGAPASAKQTPSLCLQSNEKKEEHDVNCTTVIKSVKVKDASISDEHFQTILDACIFDLCLISQSTGDNQNNISAWLNGPISSYTERIINLELTSLGCQFDGQNYLEGDEREESCTLYGCHHGQWFNKKKRIPSCCSSGGKDYENGEEATVDCKIMICNCGSWEDKMEMDPTCCEYEGVKFESGMQVTFDCWVQECSNGLWDPISRDPDCCEYEGVKYKEGDQTTFDCMVQQCNNGKWTPVSDDPDCCEYEGVKYESGMQVTFDCWVQECSNGLWDPISRDPDCCEYEGMKYKEGDQTTFDCMVQQCNNGKWTPVSDDPDCCRDGNGIYPEGTTRKINCMIEQCIKGIFVDTGDRDPDCCEHHGTYFPDGASTTIDCQAVICNKGVWKESEITDLTCCEIGGRFFIEGTQAVVDCNIFECVNGNWSDTHTMDPKCGNTNTSEHTEHTEACVGLGGGLVIQVEQQVNMP
ncbi:uncharacterized protein LOC125029119 isoform X2 [Penaeus chinensis]|uniref:uncharacterized protein LOC125029119 isoform X2 n=1 Tax=Penaeus chinensis TaxID=139456 RepID=UPI001FB6C8C7|nr:uncharacterized protein LOC125029119 isoform X2 [Penaeus chinensis]